MNNHELSWQFDLNNTTVGAGLAANNSTRNRWLLWKIKDIMISYPISPWIVVSSSNATLAGLGDHWNGYTDLNWGQTTSTARSWIVLQQPGLNNFQLLIDCRYTFGQGESTENIALSTSVSGSFTGGSTTSVPTATDGTLILQNAVWGGYNISASAINTEPVVHGMQSADGYCSRIWVYRASESLIASSVWMIDKLKNSSINCPNIYIDYTGTVSSFGSANLTSLESRCVHNGTTLQSGYTSEGVNGSLLANTFKRPNQISGEYQVYPSNCYVADSKYREIIGGFYDFYFCPDSLDTMYFADGNGTPMKWVGVKNAFLPWDGSTTMLTVG